MDGSDPVRLTHANPQIEELALASMEVIEWQSKDDMTIEGLLHLPPGYEEGTRVPFILNIHGGPASVFSNSFRPSYHIYAGLGYASLSPNVRGSSAYTDHLREGNTFTRGDGIGFGDFEDLMNGVDKVIADGVVDAERMGVKGWSYGGILGGWTITQTDRFKAASIGRRVSMTGRRSTAPVSTTTCACGTSAVRRGTTPRRGVTSRRSPTLLTSSPRRCSSTASTTPPTPSSSR